jgi:polygalacturonase
MSHLSRRQLLGLGIATVMLPRSWARADRRPFARTKAVPSLPWPAANAIVAATKLPSFADVMVDVANYGANGDGNTDNTAAFERAIEACHRSGGGHVVVPKGTYLIGAIYLRSHVDLHLDAGATLTFGADPTKFPIVLTRYEGIECMNRSPMIYAYGERNIAVTGAGTLDASRTADWNDGSDRDYLESLIARGVTDPRRRVVPGSSHRLRSSFIEPYRCDTVLIQGVTLRGAPFWQLHPTLCSNVTIDGVTTHADRGNSDGCDPECCDHVVITNCVFDDGDDNIAIKSGRDEDGRRIATPSHDIVIVDCTMTGRWGAISCGSEQTGGIENIYAYRCAARTKYVLYIKSNTRRGGFTRNVRLDGVSGKDLTGAFALVQMDYHDQTGRHPPGFGDIELSNCTADHTPYALHITGLANSHIAGLAVRDSTFTHVEHDNIITNVDDVQLTNVRLDGRVVSRRHV